jgi:hypothetical protein
MLRKLAAAVLAAFALAGAVPAAASTARPSHAQHASELRSSWG